MPNSADSKPRFVRLIIRLLGGLVLTYVAAYLVLSMLGGYQPVVSFSGGISREHLLWAPPGFYSTADLTWRRNLVSVAFYPIWSIDVQFVHKPKTSPGKS